MRELLRRAILRTRAEHVLQLIALIAINAIAFVFDGDFIRDALFVDALILGVNLRSPNPGRST